MRINLAIKTDKWCCLTILGFLLGAALLGMPQVACAGSDNGTLKLEVVSPLKRIFSSTSVTAQKNPVIELWSARNEYESLQVAFHSDDTTRVIAVEATDLANSSGSTLSAEQFEYRFPSSVRVNKHTAKTPISEVEGDIPGWFPDPLDESSGMQFTGSRSLWGTWYVPKDAAPGDYQGELIIRFENSVRRLPVLLHVWNFTLPEKPSLYVTNWLHIRHVESQYHVKRGSAAFWDVIDKIAQDMQAHRQNVIFTPLNLIKSLEQQDGRYSFDFREYDKWAEIFLRHGFQVFEGSHLFHARNSYNIQRRSRNVQEEIEFDEHQLSTVDGQNYLRQLLRALHKENGRLGIQERYIQHVDDEAPADHLQRYREVAEIVRATMPGVAIVDATMLPPAGLQGLMDIPVGVMGNSVVQTRWEAGTKWGRWWYTASYPRGLVPNRFIDYPLIKMRIIPWLSWRHGMSGYLHYAYNYWLSPTKMSVRLDVDQSGAMPPGDGFIVYPPTSNRDNGPVSSLRWETFRDGLEDYEYLLLLDRWVNSATGGDKTILLQGAGLLRDIKGTVVNPEIYPRNPVALLEFRSRMGGLLNKLAMQAEKSK